MADPILKPVSGLAPAATLTGAELVPVVQGGVTKRATAQAIANLAPAQVGGGGGAFRLAPLSVANTRWVMPPTGQGLGANWPMGINSAIFAPFVLGRAMAFTRIGLQIAVAAAGTARAAVYNNNATAGIDRPGTLVVQSADLDTGTTGQKLSVVASTTLNAGQVYWVAMSASNNPSQSAMQSTGADTVLGLTTAGAVINGLSATQATPFPADMSAATYALLTGQVSLPALLLAP